MDAAVARSGLRCSSLRPSWVQTEDNYERNLGPQVRDPAVLSPNLWSYVDAYDLADAIVLAAESELPGHEVFYIASPDNVGSRPFAELVRRYYGDGDRDPPARARGRLRDLLRQGGAACSGTRRAGRGRTTWTKRGERADAKSDRVRTTMSEPLRRVSASGRLGRWRRASFRVATNRSSRPRPRLNGSAGGGRPRRPDRRLRVPLSAGVVPDNLDEVRGALDGHDVYCLATGLHLDPVRQGRARLACEATRRGRDDAGRDRLRGRAQPNFIIWPGIEGYNYPFQTPTRRPGPGPSTASARPRSVPRPRDPLFLEHKNSEPAMKILMRNIGMTLHVINKPRRQGRQRPGEHGLGAPDHERREPGRVRGAARLGGAARPPARQLGRGPSTTTTWSARPLHGDARARRRLRRAATATRRAPWIRPVPVHRGRRRGREAQRAPVAIHRGHGREIDDAALREAQMRKDAVRAYEIVYPALGANVAAFVGLDAGTTGVKAVAISPNGDVVAGRSKDTRSTPPRRSGRSRIPRTGGARARLRWLRRCRAGRRDGLPPRCTGSSRWTRERVLRPAILGTDQRTSAESAEIERRIGLERLIRLTGNRALTGFTAPKLLWLRAHEPEAFGRIDHVLLPKDYVRLRLTGERATDVADASGTLLFDVAERRGAASARGARAPRAWLPEALESPEVSARTASGPGRRRRGRPGGRRARVGVDRPGALSVAIGTSGLVFAALPASWPIRARACTSSAMRFRAAWHAMGVMLSAAGSLSWFRVIRTSVSYETFSGGGGHRAVAEE